MLVTCLHCERVFQLNINPREQDSRIIKRLIAIKLKRCSERNHKLKYKINCHP